MTTAEKIFAGAMIGDALVLIVALGIAATRADKLRGER